ncbi:MAG: 2Fe-2S iron-sulfur cluster-binding protein [Actinomycetota bacterium]
MRWAMSGNICRCTGYRNIITAIQAAGQEMSPTSEEVSA